MSKWTNVDYEHAITDAEMAARVADDPEWQWWRSDPATQLSVPPLFIDGMPHERGADDANCCRFETCWRCGVGNVHYQGVYGGLVRKCDHCLADL